MCSTVCRNIAAILYCVCCLILLGLAFALFIPTAKYIGIIASVPTLLLASIVATILWTENTVLLSITIFLNIAAIVCLGTAIGIGSRIILGVAFAEIAFEVVLSSTVTVGIRHFNRNPILERDN